MISIRGIPCMRVQRAALKQGFCFQKRLHSSSSIPPQDSNDKNIENEEQQQQQQQQKAKDQADLGLKTSTSPAGDVKDSFKTHKTSKIALSQSQPQSQQQTTKKIKSKSAIKRVKRKLEFSEFPTVPSTEELNQESLKKDIFFGGYRPILTPVKQQRRLMKKNKIASIPIGSSSSIWNSNAILVANYEESNNVPKWVLNNLVPFKNPPEPGSEVRLGVENLQEQEAEEKNSISKEIEDFIKFFKK